MDNNTQDSCTVKLREKFYHMTESQVLNFMNQRNEGILRDLEDKRITMDATFQAFAKVWLALPVECEHLLTASLRNFCNNLVAKLPQYAVMRDHKEELNNITKEHLSQILISNSNCSDIHKDIVFNAVTDFEPTIGYKIAQQRMYHESASKNSLNLS